jgi:hypothetical protein
MKVAFHFSPNHEMLNGLGGDEIEELVLRTMINQGDFSTAIRVGNLLFRRHAMEWRGTALQRTGTYSESRHLAMSVAWFQALAGLWTCFLPINATKCLTRNAYVICMESVSLELARRLSVEFRFLPYFLGALEVDDRIPLHSQLYSDDLIPWLRLAGKSVYVFKDYFDEEGSVDGLESFIELGALDAQYEMP